MKSFEKERENPSRNKLEGFFIGVKVGESGSEWGKEYLRIFEKFGVRHPPSQTPL
jgi:hypothetical protein